MGDLSALREEAKFLLKYGSTRPKTTRLSSDVETDEEKKDRRKSIEKCRPHAANAFKLIGGFDRSEIDDPAVWKTVMAVIAATGGEDLEKYNKKGVDELKSARLSVTSFDHYCSVGTRIMFTVVGLILIAVGAAVWFSNRPPISSAFETVMIIVMSCTFLAGLATGGVAFGLVALVVAAGLVWLVINVTAGRAIAASFFALFGLYYISSLITGTRAATERFLKRGSTRTKYIEARGKASALLADTERSLDALDEFSSDKCSGELYRNIAYGVSWESTLTNTTQKWDENGEYSETSSRTKMTNHLNFNQIRDDAKKLIDIYRPRAEALRKAITDVDKVFSDAGVDL